MKKQLLRTFYVFPVSWVLRTATRLTNEKKIALFMALLLCSSVSMAQIYVSTSGNDANDGKSIANAKLTLAGAISAVGAEAVPYIKIGAGTFNSGGVAVPVGVRIVGEGVGQTIINMTASSLALQSNSTLSNVTIKRTAPLAAGGQPSTSVSTYIGSSGITIKNCKFEGNRTAIYLQGSNHVIIDNEFQDNRTGLVIDPSGTPSITGLVLERNQFYRNRSYAMIFLGAADGVTDANAVTGRIANNNFIENGAGGIELNVNNASTAITLEGNHFAGLSSGVFAQRTNGGFTVDDHNSAATYPYNFTDIVVDGVTYPNTVSGVAAGKFILKGDLNNSLNAYVSRKALVSSNMPIFSSYVYIQDAIQYSNAGATLNVDEGTYTLTDAIKLTKSITLQGNDNNLAAKPIITGVGNATNKSLVEIDAPNVTVKNFEFQIAQEGNALNGLTTLATDNFNNLTIADNIFKGTAAQSGAGFTWLSHAMKIGRGMVVSNNLINVVRNSITYANLAAPQLFGRGIYAYNTYGKIGGSLADANTILAIYALHGGEIGGGAGKDFEFSYNIVPAGLVSIVGAEVGNHKLSYNSIGNGILDLATAETVGRHMEIKGSRTLGANIEIANNQIKNYANIGLFLQRSNNITVKDNTFTPFIGANTFNSVVFSSKEGTSGPQSAATSQNLSITGNAFNGTDGTGIAFWNHNASASVPPLNNAKIGGSNADKNTFAATLGAYIALDATTTGTTAAMGTLYDVTQTGTNTTNILPFNSDINAVNNVFGSVDTGVDRSAVSLTAVKTKIFDKDNNVAVGEVIMSLSVRNLTTGENFASIQSAIDDTDTQNGDVIDVDAGTYTLTTSININKEVVLQGNDNNLAAKPIIKGVGNATNQSLLEIDAPNVTVKNFEFQIAQTGDALNGITTLATDNFNNLTIADNVFKGVKPYSAGFVFASHAMKIGRQSVNSPSEVPNNLVNIVRNSVIYTNMVAPELFGRGLYAYNVYGKIGGSVANKNTIIALYALQAGEIGGGTGKDFEFSNNLVPVGFVSVLAAEVGNHKISANSVGDGITSLAIANQFGRHIEIKGIRTAGANVEVSDNQIKNYANIGLFIQRSNNVSVKNNTFSPIGDANAFYSTVFSSKEGTAGSQAAVASENLSITSNIFNGTGGTGIAFWNHNADVAVKPLNNAKIGGADADKNTFASTLTKYIDLDVQSGNTSAMSAAYDVVQTPGVNQTNILPFNSDIDASYNVFGAVNSGTSTNFDDLVSAKAKISDGVDNGLTGYVNIQPQKAFVASTTDFANGLVVVPDDFTLLLKNDAAIYGALGDRTLTKAHTFAIDSYVAGEITFGKLTLNALTKEVNFTQPAKVADNFVLTEGKINAPQGMTLNGAKTITFDAAKPANFINGKVKIVDVGSQNVSVIIGNGTKSSLVGLSDFVGALNSDFEVQYFPTAYVNTTTFNPANLGYIHNKEYWSVNKLSGVLAANVKLGVYDFGTSGFTTFASTDATIARFDGLTNSWLDAGNSNNDDLSNPAFITSNSNADFGVFTFAKTPIAVLPVNLTDFTAKATVGGAIINWTTTREVNNASFEIEKSLNGKDFSVIGTKIATGSGSYDFLDVNFKQSAYYRLVQVDISGKKTTYNDLVKFVKGLDNGLSVVVYPNPVANKLYVTVGSSTKEAVKLLLTDMSGKVVKVTTTDSSQSLELDVTGIPSGSYVLQVIKNSGNVSKKILKR